MKQYLDNLLLRLARYVLRRGELRLADAQYDLNKWGFAKRPSEKARAERRIAILELKVERLRTTLERIESRRVS